MELGRVLLYYHRYADICNGRCSLISRLYSPLHIPYSGRKLQEQLASENPSGLHCRPFASSWGVGAGWGWGEMPLLEQLPAGPKAATLG